MRRIQIMRGNYTAQVLSTVYVKILPILPTDAANALSSVFVIQAVIIGTTFVRMTDATSGYFSRGGVLFLYVPLPHTFYKLITPFYLT